MSSKNKNNKNRVNKELNKEINKAVVKDDTEEVDKILEQLDEMESKNNAANMSSRVKNLIKEDKAAIKEMQEKLKEMEDDDLDFLDDEKTVIDTPVKEEAEEKVEEKTEEKTEKKANNNSKKNKKKNKNKSANQQKNAEEAGVKEENKDNIDSTDSEVSDSEEEGAKLDFFANLEKKDKEERVNIYADRIRKKQPKRLKRDEYSDLSFFERVKKIAGENKVNAIVGTAIAFLFVILIIALVVDSNNKAETKKTQSVKKSGEFINMNTSGIVDAVNAYHAALIKGDIEQIKQTIVNPEKVSENDLNDKIAQTAAYQKLVGEGFSVTDCYVQRGLEDNEYICYMKFELKIKSIETPAVGLFTCYVKDVTSEELEKSEEAKVHIYKVDTSVNDASSEVCKYVLKMSQCKNVKELFEQVDNELLEACENDPDLKSIVDALSGTEASTEETSVDEETTVPDTTAATEETSAEETTEEASEEAAE